MVKLEELEIAKDVGIGGFSLKSQGVWYGLDGRIEDLILKEKCLGCPKGVQEKCIILTDVQERGAYCEVQDDSIRQSKFSEAPCPQVGQLYDEYKKKHAPKPVVVESPAPEPEPKKASIVDKLKTFVGAG